MATETRNQMIHNDNRAILWTVLAIIIAILAYAAYAAYYRPNYSSMTMGSNTAIPSTTNATGTSGTATQ